jgi:secretion/DNA translocation related CpaE-like protein
MMVAPGELAEELARLAAAAGCEPSRASDLDALREQWSSAPLVLLDTAAASAASQAGLPRRDGVVIVCPHAEPDAWRCAVAVGAQQVAVLPDAEAWLVGALADVVDAPTQPAGRVLAVLGGRGGAGASVFAAAVAVAVAGSGRQALLLDCDALSGGLDLTLGVERLDGLRWSGLHFGGGRVPAAVLHAALPTTRLAAQGGLTVLSCDREGRGPDGDAVRAVCRAGRRAGETVICDVPRYPCEPASAALEAADLAVLVVPAEVRACAAAAVVAKRVLRCGVPLRLVVRGPGPGGLTPDDVGRALELPVLTAMPAQPRLAAMLDRGGLPGQSRGPLARAARQVLDALEGSARVGGGGAA